MSSPNSYPGTQTVRRAIALLKLFSDGRPEWSLSDLARAAGLNKSTAYRLLQTLEMEGMLSRGPHSDAYRLGPEAIALGGRALRSSDLRAASRTEALALAEATQETVTLEVLAGAEVLILDEVAGAHVLGNIQSLGTRWPIHATSTGKVLLAYMSEAAREAILATGLARLTDHTCTSAAALQTELAQVRRQGYATAYDELEAGFAAVGAPIRNYTGAVVAALSVGGPTLRLPVDSLPALGQQVIQAADRVSHRLGL